MNISLKSLKTIFLLVTFNLLLGVVLVSQLKPEVLTWRLATLQILFYTISAGLYFYVFRVFGKNVITAPSTQKRRFSSRIKTQLWGLLLRTASGAVGIGIAAILLPLDPRGVLVVSVFYAVIVILGFFNDGKHFDETHI